MIYDEVEGLNFYAELGLIAEAFANPEIIKGPYRWRVRSYLDDDSVSPLPFRRLAEQDAAKASRLFQLLLNRPSFSWRADGEEGAPATPQARLLRQTGAAQHHPPQRDRPGALPLHHRRGSRGTGATAEVVGRLNLDDGAALERSSVQGASGLV